MKFAFLLMYELRAVKKTYQELYKNLIKPYDADIFICVQKALNDDDERLNLFNENVICKEIYDKPEPISYFGIENNLNVTSMDDHTTSRHNWNKYSNLQVYINYHKMAQIISKHVDKYDYFILIRCDSYILFPFPDKKLFENIPKFMYFINAQYCKGWGDKGIPTFIHRNYILDYLNSYYNIISNPSYKPEIINALNASGLLNQEKFQNKCLSLVNLQDKIQKINSLNYYWTAENVNDYNTWSCPHYSPIYNNVICKYDGQCNEAHENYNLWLNGKRWKFDINNNYFYLG